MTRVAALLLGLAATLPTAADGQHETRWFFDTGIGASWPAAYAFDRGSSARVGLGMEVGPSVALDLSVDAERLPYSNERFASLFLIADPAAADVGALAADVVSVSARVEWTPVQWGSVAPLLGLTLSVQHRGESGFFESPAWGRCSPVSPAPEPGCAELRQDIRVDGTSLGLTSSVGMRWSMEGSAIAGVVRFSPNLLPGSPVLSTDLVWRYYF